MFTNDVEGSGTLTITSVTFTVNDQIFTVDLTEEGPGQATPPPITADKTWTDDVELTLVKSTSVAEITPGSTVPYTFTVTNVSRATSSEVVVTDPLPAGLTFVSSPDGCTADAAQVVTCTAATLAPGEEVTFNIVTQASDPFPDTAIDPDGMVPNTATLFSPDTNCEPEREPAGVLTVAAISPLQATAEDCVSTVLLPVPPTLALEKTSTATEITPGGEIPYLITVNNTGLVMAPDVLVIDSLPDGLTYVSSDPTCTASGQTVTCPIGDLAIGATATVDLVTMAADPFPTNSDGMTVNVATVEGANSNCAAGSSDPVCSDTEVLPLTVTSTPSPNPPASTSPPNMARTGGDLEPGAHPRFGALRRGCDVPGARCRSSAVHASQGTPHGTSPAGLTAAARTCALRGHRGHRGANA